jgi:hypothetical protein
MIKKVLDANFFQDNDLEVYLSTNPQNIVVFTDFACMEAYKGDAILSIQKSLKIVSRYPAQVVVLKPTREIIRHQHATSITSGVTLEDQNQTKGFQLFCKHVRLASAGNPELSAQILAHGREASRHFDLMQDASSDVAAAIEEVSAELRPDYLRFLKKRESLSPEAAEEMIQKILLLTALFMKKHPDVSAIPRYGSELKGSYIFRYSIATFLLAMRWISDGGAKNVKPQKLRNDVVDMTYVVYATFFDGLLSRDKKATEIYEETRFLLDEVFVSEP